jgi:hypothetical protein
VTRLELCQEARRVVDIAARIEHRLDGRKMLRMIVVIDLHAAEIDQADALGARPVEFAHGFLAASGEDGAARRC